MKLLIALPLFSIFLFLSGIHFYWGLGGKWGGQAVVPTKTNNEKVMMPGWVACFIVALGLLGFGLFVLIKAGLLSLSLPSWILNYGLWIIAFIFILRAIGDFNYVGFFKKVKSTDFGRQDTRYYSPLCLLIGILAILIQLL